MLLIIQEWIQKFLRNTVYDNIQEINKIIEEELSKLTNYQIEQGMNINIGEDEEIDWEFFRTIND